MGINFTLLYNQAGTAHYKKMFSRKITGPQVRGLDSTTYHTQFVLDSPGNWGDPLC